MVGGAAAGRGAGTPLGDIGACAHTEELSAKATKAAPSSCFIVKLRNVIWTETLPRPASSASNNMAGSDLAARDWLLVETGLNCCAMPPTFFSGARNR